MYSYKSTPWDFSFQSHNDLMNHLCKVHFSESKRNGDDFKKSVEDYKKYTTKESDPKQGKVPACTNGDQCRYHNQDRCNFFHALPPQKQQGQVKGQSNQRKVVQKRQPNRQRHQGVQYQQQPYQQGWRNQQQHQQYQQGWGNKQQHQQYQQGWGNQQQQTNQQGWGAQHQQNYQQMWGYQQPQHHQQGWGGQQQQDNGQGFNSLPTYWSQ